MRGRGVRCGGGGARALRARPPAAALAAHPRPPDRALFPASLTATNFGETFSFILADWVPKDLGADAPAFVGRLLHLLRPGGIALLGTHASSLGLGAAAPGHSPPPHHHAHIHAHAHTRCPHWVHAGAPAPRGQLHEFLQAAAGQAYCHSGEVCALLQRSGVVGTIRVIEHTTSLQFATSEQLALYLELCARLLGAKQGLELLPDSDNWPPPGLQLLAELDAQADVGGGGRVLAQDEAFLLLVKQRAE